jgi:anaphase-promoting complex subunit 3
VEQAHHLLHTHGARTDQTKFLLARCAADLGKDAEAEAVLRGPGGEVRKEVRLDEMEKRFGADRAAFALQILSSLYARTERHAKAADADRKVLKLNPLLWKSFESLSLAGELADPEVIWDPAGLESVARCTGSNPVMNLVNAASAQQPARPVTPVPAPPGPETPQQLPGQKVASLSALSTPTPCQPPRPHIQLNDSSLNNSATSTPQPAGGMETPLMGYNSIASTPGQTSPMGPPLSGISALNITSDTSTDCPTVPQYKLAAMAPPPLKPKARRLTSRCGPGRAFSPTFGTLGDSPSPAGVAAKLLEFSSPQVVLLSASSPVLHPAKAPLVAHGTPQGAHPASPLPLRTSTPGVPPLPSDPEPRPVKRVAMAAKPDNAKANLVLAPSLQTMANVITPSPVSLPPRRSSRLFGSTQSVKENSKGPGKGRIKSKSRLLQSSNRQMSENELNEKNRLSDGKERIGGAVLEPDSKPCRPGQPVNLPAEAEKLQRASVKGLLHLLRQLGSAFLLVGQYDCREAARLLELLPARHAASSWVLATLGKCYFEMNEYKEACRHFTLVREKDPFRLELMEYYSTALWHLQEEVQLSALAQDLQRLDKFSAAAWCAAGNCFSHQKEHENAIKFFQRAVQVCSN